MIHLRTIHSVKIAGDVYRSNSAYDAAHGLEDSLRAEQIQTDCPRLVTASWVSARGVSNTVDGNEKQESYCDSKSKDCYREFLHNPLLAFWISVFHLSLPSTASC